MTFSNLFSLLSVAMLVPSSSSSDKQYVGLSNSTVPLSLTPKHGLTSGDQFGHAVAIWEGYCLVSATQRGIVSAEGRVDADGVVFVFYRDDYRQWKDSGITLASYQPDDGFGESLSLYSTTAVVGAPKDDTLATDAGYAYIFFTTSGGIPFGNVQKVSADRPEQGDFFGYSVAILPGVGYYSHGAVVIGAYGHNRDAHVVDSGSVFIFANSGTTWYQATVIQPSQPYASGYFGWSVSGYGNVIAVGAPGQESVFVYHMEGVEHECPHDGPPDQMPAACQMEEEPPHRRLQGGPPDAHAHTYSLWEYVEVLHIQNDLQFYKGDNFGASVAVTNESALMLVIGSPNDNDGGKQAGAVTIVCLLPEDDLWSSWTPAGETTKRRSRRHLRQLQGGGGGGGEAPDGDRPEDRMDHSQNIWNIRSSEYTTDKDGSYWMKMTKRLGMNAKEMYGYRTAISSQHLLIGTNAGSVNRGRAELMVFNKTSPGVESPVYKGSLYSREWLYETPLFDYNGGAGDYFGSAVDLYQDTAVVGGYLTGFESSFSLGTGGAYIFDSYTITVTKSSGKTTTGTSGNSDSSLSASSSLVSAFLFIVVVVIAAAIVSTQSSRWFSSHSPASLTMDTKKDLDSSVGSVDTVDMDSRHPLQRDTKRGSSKPSPYSHPSSSSSQQQKHLPMRDMNPPVPAGKYRGLHSGRPKHNSSGDDNEDEESALPSSRHGHSAMPSKRSKTAKYLQSNTTAAYGGHRSSRSSSSNPRVSQDSDSDGSDHR